MTTDVKIDKVTVSKLVKLTTTWANATLMNDAGALMSSRKEMNKILDDFDKEHGTKELQIDTDMLAENDRASVYMMKRMEYLQQRCG